MRLFQQLQRGKIISLDKIIHLPAVINKQIGIFS